MSMELGGKKYREKTDRSVQGKVWKGYGHGRLLVVTTVEIPKGTNQMGGSG